MEMVGSSDSPALNVRDDDQKRGWLEDEAEATQHLSDGEHDSVPWIAHRPIQRQIVAIHFDRPIEKDQVFDRALSV